MCLASLFGGLALANAKLGAVHGIAGPFGGMKMSGIGRELGQEGLDEYYEVKHVHWDIEGNAKDFWYPY